MTEEKLTLTQQIEDLAPDPDDDTVFFIGSHTAFFFVGTRAEYERVIHRVSDRLLEDAKERLENMRSEVEELPAVMEKISRIDHKSENPAEFRELYALARRLGALTLDVGRFRKTRAIPKAEEYIAGFKPVPDRKVKRTYSRTQGDGVVIIVEGKENAKYWFYEEFKTGKVEEDDE